MNSLSPSEWDARFIRQARWTRALRDYLFPRAGVTGASRILEVGCGTGAILAELQDVRGADWQSALLIGLDTNIAHLNLAMRHAPRARLTQGDALTLPYADNAFDVTLCHFLLLWVASPRQALSEMVRVTRPGGAVLALAEPDYGGRVDHPPALAVLGAWQRASLRRQGADPLIGRRLTGLFHAAGLADVETGVLGGQWAGLPDWDAWESEWAVLESDLNAKTSPVSETWEALKALDQAAWERGERVLFVPTFYAWGRVA